MRWKDAFKRIDVWGINYHGLPWDGRGFNFHQPPYRLFPASPGNSGAWQSPGAMMEFLRLLEGGNYTHVFLMQDTFNLSKGDFAKALNGICDRKGIVSVLYFPVDAPLEPEWTKIIQAVDVPVAYTEYGREEALRAIAPTQNPGETFATKIEVMPHGVDQKVYEPLPLRGELQKEVFRGSEQNNLVLLNVNQHQRRKDPVRSLEVLRALVDMRMPVRLLMHMPAISVHEQIDLEAAGRQLGLQRGRHWVHSGAMFNMNRAMLPETGLNRIYNACDLLISTTLGEGWGLSTTEALAAGCPAAIPRHTACEEIAVVMRRLGQGEKGGEPTVTLLPIEKQTVCHPGDNTRLRRRVDVEGAAVMLRDMIRSGAVMRGERALGLCAAVADWLSWDRIAAKWLQLMEVYKEPKEQKAKPESGKVESDPAVVVEVPEGQQTVADQAAVPSAFKIPRVIWQTYRSKPLPEDAARCAATWREKNPDYGYQLWDDLEITEWMRETFGGETFAAFQAMPIGVMKADFWRYAVLYQNGGVYADVDCTCVVPCDRWLRHAPEGDCLVVGLENDVHWCQWTLAATPKHPVLAKVIDLIVRRAAGGIDPSYEHFVHKHSGPGIWSEAVHEALGLQHQDAIKNWNAVKGSPVILALNDRAFHGQYVDHHFGSRNFKGGYPRWIDERAAVWKKAKGQGQPAIA